MSKCVLPENRAAIKIEQYCKRRKDRKRPKWQKDSSCVFAYFFSRHLPSPRYRRKRKSAGIASAQIRKKKLCKKPLGRYGRKIVQGEASSRPCMPQSECGAGHTGFRTFSDPLPGGSQDTGGAFRSRVQRPSVRHRSIGAGHICPMWQRTDLAQVKRDRHTGEP